MGDKTYPNVTLAEAKEIADRFEGWPKSCEEWAANEAAVVTEPVKSDAYSFGYIYRLLMLLADIPVGERLEEDEFDFYIRADSDLHNYPFVYPDQRPEPGAE